METPLLYRQLMDQLRQWVNPKDERHLQGVAEAVAAILQSQSACLGKWVTYLSHRNCEARAHMERLSYLVHNQHISAERFYVPLLRHALQAFDGSEITLTLDTSMLWEQFCLVEVCLVWGGRSFALAQVVLEHKSASVAFKDYKPVLEAAKALVPSGCGVTLLADRGFAHRELLVWLEECQWQWAVRVKCDMQVRLATGATRSVQYLFPPEQQAYLLHNVTVLEDIEAHLVTGHLPNASEPWAVLSSTPPSLQTFALYGKRFGGIEPHFKDYKSAAFNVVASGLRDAQALTCLFMLLDTAYLIALIVGMILVQSGQRSKLDWHGDRGLSFLQLGLRNIGRCCYRRVLLPTLIALPPQSPPKACASRRKRAALDCQIEFSRVVVFS